MNFLKKTACTAAAVSLCIVNLTACSGNEIKQGGSSADSKAVTASESKADEKAEEESAAENAGSTADSDTDSESVSEKDKTEVGELLAAAAEIFGSDYTFSAKITYSDEPESYAECTQARRGGDIYMHNTQVYPDSLDYDITSLYLDGTIYEADNNIGAYRVFGESEEVNADEMSVVLLVANYGLERTSTHIPADTEGMTVEEYTYTGDTYMTIYDFYFDESGALKKYTTVYSVEGEDDIIQTTEVISLEAQADESLFDLNIFDGMKAFDELTEDERLGFCQQMCGKFSVTTDMMNEMSITTDDFKTIDLSRFSTLIQTYGEKPKADEDSKTDKKDASKEQKEN